MNTVNINHLLTFIDNLLYNHNNCNNNYDNNNNHDNNNNYVDTNNDCVIQEKNSTLFIVNLDFGVRHPICAFFNFNLLFPFSRIGIDYFNSNHNNISFFSSIIFFINPQILLQQFVDRQIYQSRFFDKLRHKKTLKNYNHNLTTQILQNISDFQITDELLLYVANFCYLNFIILDKNTQQIICYTDETFNHYKNNIFFIKHESFFEPVVSEQSHFFCFEQIKSLFNSDTVFIFNSKIHNSDHCNTFDITQLNSTMLYDKIKEIAKSYNINLYSNNKKKTKQILINEITQLYKDKNN